MIVDLLVNLETAEGTLVDPETLMAAAKAAGLDGMVLTMPGVLSPDLGAYRAAAEAAGLTVFSGTEIPTSHGLVLALLPTGQVLAPDFAPRSGSVYDAGAAIDGIETAGGAAIALRPYDRDLPHPMGDHLFALQGLDACEVMSGRLGEVANDLALEAASNLEMPCVGTSGARGTEGLGTAATLLRKRVEDESELVAIIKRGDCWPLGFSDELPKEAKSAGSERGGPRGHLRAGSRGGARGRDRGREEGRDPGRDPGREGVAEAGGGRGARGVESRGTARGRASPRRERAEARDSARPSGRSSKRGRGRGKGGPTRVTAAPEHADRLPDDYGNRMTEAEVEDNLPPDDIGNRLRPGEQSPYHQVGRREPGGPDDA